MKLITEKALEKIETDYDCLVTNGRYDLELKLLWLTDDAFKEGEEKLKKDKVPYTRGNDKRTLVLKQSKLDGIVDMIEERVWLSKSNTLATPTSEMDQQRLSNAVHLLEVYLKAEKITKLQGEDYLARLSESIIPELNERFNGELLPYKPFFDWEKALVKEAKIKL